MWLLCLVGLLARLYRFASVPVSLYWDEVAIGLDARSLITTGLDINGHHWLQPLFISYGDYKAPVYIWLTALLGKLINISEFAVRLPSLIASFVTAWTIFKLIKLLSAKNSQLPLFTLANFLIMPWAIHFARIGFESHLSLCFLSLTVYFTVKAVKQQKSWLLIPAGFLGLLGIYTYISLRFLVPVLFLVSFWLFRPKNIKPYLISFSLSLLFIIGGSLILAHSSYYSLSQQYRLSNNNLMTSTAYIDESAKALVGQPLTFVNRLVYHRYFFKAKEYLNNYFQYFSPQFLFLSGDPNLRHHSGFGGQLLYLQAILLIIGCFSLFCKLKPLDWLMLIWLALSPTVAALVNEPFHASRAIYMMVPLAWLCGLGFEKISRYRRLSFLLSISLIINLSLYLHYYFIHFPKISQSSWLNQYKQAALYLKTHPADQPIFVDDQWFQPQLYFDFYAHTSIKPLPDFCPIQALCLAPKDWQTDTTRIVADIPGTDQLVVKVLNEKQ